MGGGGHDVTAPLEVVDPAFDQGLEHRDAGVVLIFRCDQVPARALVIGRLHHEVEGLEVRRTLLPISPVVRGELPVLERIVGPVLESLELLLVRDV